ncbi:MAG: hypothetical protein CMI53_00790 [Parcubacteria group bacterium]|nr:hypothetical protein [Parcubacteria group bacterium]|tara:strand:- start:1625 stop:2848 length:1224 start_codon:yes stop_codon:yes gene_type:complete
MKFSKLNIILLIVGGALAFFIWQSNTTGADSSITDKEPEPELTYTKKIEITDGSTYGILMQEARVPTSTRQLIFTAAEDVYDLSKVRLGRTIDLIYNKQSDELEQLVYQIDSEEKLYVSQTVRTSTTATSSDPIWSAARIAIPYEIKIATAEGVIDSSMYEAALAKGIDERAVIAFAEAFQWTVDFVWQVRQGDTFKFIYEERYLDGEYIMPGQVLAGKFVNDGDELYAFYYQESEDNLGFFDQNGDSAQKIFLKAPVAFKYITSGFTTGSRYISAFNISTGHRAIDYAATYGTPVRSVGDGTISFAGWDGSYGNKVSVHHNGTYSTNYAHMSRLAVSYGQKVSQGQTIGYVGSTGLSTGPHLHYEMVKYGTKINPLREVFPPSKGIAEENKETYFGAITDLRQQLD